MSGEEKSEVVATGEATPVPQETERGRGPPRGFRGPPFARPPWAGPCEQHPWFTKDELRTFWECRRESFWYRSLPLSLVFMGSSYLAVSRGYLRGHKKYGSLFWNIFAGFLGYQIGKASYMPTCFRKLEQLPNSRVAEMMKKRKENWSSACPTYFGRPSTKFEEEFCSRRKTQAAVEPPKQE